MKRGEMIVLFSLLFLGGVGAYFYIQSKKSRSGAPIPAPPQDTIIQATSKYALNPLDLQYAQKVANVIEQANGYTDDWGGWWFSDLPAYMPSGSRDNAQFLPANSKGQVTLTERIANSTNELGTNANWNSLKGTPNSPDVQLFTLVRELNSKLAFGITS